MLEDKTVYPLAILKKSRKYQRRETVKRRSVFVFFMIIDFVFCYLVNDTNIHTCEIEFQIFG